MVSRRRQFLPFKVFSAKNPDRMRDCQQRKRHDRRRHDERLVGDRRGGDGPVSRKVAWRNVPEAMHKQPGVETRKGDPPKGREVAQRLERESGERASRGEAGASGRFGYRV